MLAVIGMVHLAAATDWLPVSQADLKMTSEPLAPGAPAIILYRQVDRSDAGFYQDTYVRIKILTADGLKYASVAIPFDDRHDSIRDIHGRTIQPDGTVVDFDGKVYERPLVQRRGVKVLEKTFTLPAASVGSIVEYRYEELLPVDIASDSHLIISENLFTRDAKFSLEPNEHFSIEWIWPRGLPDGSAKPKMVNGAIRLEVHNVPAFVTEDHMPPANELKYRMDFIYRNDPDPEKDPVKFWKRFAKRAYDAGSRFADERRAMSQAVSRIVLPSDSPETKLRKIYARVEQIHDLALETPAQREAQREDPQKIRDVADVWDRGYGSPEQIAWLLYALARAAGLQADPALASTRDRYFFNPRLTNPLELNSVLVIVTVGGMPTYFEPGVPFTRFGLLPWYETGVSALRLGRDGGAWISTPLPKPADSRIDRKATLQLENGALSGELVVTYTGLEASWRRRQERNDDERARRQFLENGVEAVIPTGAHVKLTNSPDWSDTDVPLVAEFHLEVPGWATPAGRHQLIPVGLFSGAEKHTFEHAERVHPIYYDFPYLHQDEVTITLPSGWNVASLPKPRDVDLKAVAYESKAGMDGRTLHLTRDLTLNFLIIGNKSYDALRQFFETVRNGDDDDVVLSAAAVAQSR
ncbi:MAG: DUF3857 domain-containing protein [Steroidobacteraceae bacterium]